MNNLTIPFAFIKKMMNPLLKVQCLRASERCRLHLTELQSIDKIVFASNIVKYTIWSGLNDLSF